MKVIISHDVDHISVFEHKKDFVIPKAIMRWTGEFLTYKITRKELYLRFIEIKNNQWNNIQSLMEFDKKNKIPSTFFFGMANGLGLSYNKLQAAYWINKVIENGFEVGVHGIEFDNYSLMVDEFNSFNSIVNNHDFGIRIHYLRQNETTLQKLSKIGYKYDTTEYSLNQPYKIENLWVFPVNIMDSYEIEKNRWGQKKSLDIIKDNTKQRIEFLVSNYSDPFINIIFHDHYYSPAYKTWRDWYEWLCGYFISMNCTFRSYFDAIQILDKKQNISD